MTRVRTDRGDVDTEYVVVACGVWSPRIAALAGAAIPLTPAVHQMIDVGPIAELAATGREIAFPIVRDMDPLMYERQSGADLEIGSYAHRPILCEPEDIPSLAAAALSPTQLPFTPDDFDPQMEAALELFHPVLDRPDAGIRHAINGLLSLTPDGHPLLGETPEVRGLWSAAAVWIKEGPGVGRLIAEWMTEGAPEIDAAASDIARFAPHERTRHHVRARASEGFNKTYGITHPREQWSSDRGLRRSPFHEREVALGAEFFEVAGWERPQWYASNAPLVRRARRARPPARVGRALVVADHQRRAPGDAPGRAMIDLSAFSQFDVCGPGALAYIQHLTVAQMDRPVGRVIYTPVLGPDGGFRSDLTVVRLGDRHFRVVTGGSDGARDLAWFRRHLPGDGVGGADRRDLGGLHPGALGPAGPRRPRGGHRRGRVRRRLPVRHRAHDHDRLDPGPRAAPVLRRRARVGAARAHRVRPAPVGHGRRGGRAARPRARRHRRLRHHRAHGEGLPARRPRARRRARPGGGGARAARAEVPGLRRQGRVHQGPRGRARGDAVHADRSTTRSAFPQGGEPVLTPDGARITDRRGRPSFVTSAGAGPSLGTYLLMAYLPPWHALEGTGLLVEYLGERYPVTVARAGRTPLFDPDDTRMR